MSAVEIKTGTLVFVKPVVCLGRTLIQEQQGHIEKVLKSNDWDKRIIYVVALDLEHRQVEMYRSGFTKR